MKNKCDKVTQKLPDPLDYWEQLARHKSLIPTRGKIPVEKNWQQYCQTLRTFDRADFEGMNAGIACGPASGVLVLDIDNIKLFKNLCNENDWELPPTSKVTTGNEGYHYHFKYPDDGHEYGNKSWREPDPADFTGNNKVTVFDVRGVGGQVLAPGSIHPETGNYYRLFEVDNLPMADAPQWLLDYCRRESASVDTFRPQYESETSVESIDISALSIPDSKKELILAGKSKGQRSEAFISVVSSLLIAGCSDSEIKAVMNQYPIGSKYREKGASRNRWLQSQIQSAKKFVNQCDANKKQEKEKKKGPASQADLLMEIATTDTELFMYYGQGYVRLLINGHDETHKIKSDIFRQFLRLRYFQQHRKAPGAQAIKDVVETVEAQARFTCQQQPIFIRVAEHQGSIYIDLGTPDWQVVEINPRLPMGWHIIQRAPVNFIRGGGFDALPIPVHGGDINELKQVINCPDHQAFLMMVGWLVGSLNPYGPFPLLILNGEQGSAKSSTTRVLHRLIDPSLGLLRAFPDKERDLIISACNSWVLSYDNISGCKKWLSDAFCRLSTGASFTPRKLFEDDQEVYFKAKRPVILNGINNMATMPDLVDRSIIVDLPPLKAGSRLSEDTLNKRFDVIYPRLLGALYSAVAQALRMKNKFSLIAPPRMADYAIWVTAAESALGWNTGDFVNAYDSNRADGADSALDSSILAKAVQSLMSNRHQWKGFADQLLTDLNKLPEITDDIRRDQFWPKAANQLTRQLKRIATPLRENKGIDIAKKKKSAGTQITITSTDTCFDNIEVVSKANNSNDKPAGNTDNFRPKTDFGEEIEVTDFFDIFDKK